jgi:aminopeptidase N
MPRPSISACLLPLLLTLASPAAAQPAGYDAASGAQNAVYPPHRLVDHKHLRIELTIPDMNVPKASATATIRLAAIRGQVPTITLDAKSLAIDSVTCKGRKATHAHDGRKLAITFDPPLEQEQEVEVAIAYRIDDPRLGLVWTPESPAWPGRAAQLHTQGQPETNSYWFPCHDFPNERLTTELVVTAPAAYEVSSNGRLVSKENVIHAADSPTKGRSLVPCRRWRFLQDKEHVNYLVTLVVGKFDIVDVRGASKLPMPVYVAQGRGSDVKGTYGNTAAMVARFESLLDEPYPWDKYAQLVVWNFGAGGMENTSATTMYDTALHDRESLDDHDLDGLISHELAHQWFGNLITCNSWEHIWLNEGFATYLTALWYEQRDGFAGYQRLIRGNFDGTAGGDAADAPNQVGMVSKIYTHPWETFRRPANPYSKGSSILHMLRMRLGDDRFFKGVRLYVDRHRFTTVETIDLRRALEEASGENLEQFFSQWCSRPGVPALTVTSTHDAATGMLSIEVEQTQKIDGDNPAFEFDLPILVHAGGGTMPCVVSMAGRKATLSISMPTAPTCIEVDPNLHVLAALTVRQPEDALLAHLKVASSPASRILALRGLSGGTSADAVAPLVACASDAKLPSWVRAQAVRTLAARGSFDALHTLWNAKPDHWEVREAIVASMPLAAKASPAATDHVVSSLATIAGEDSSLKVRCTAIKALGEIKSPAGTPAILDALTRESQSDGLRVAALEALASLDDKSTLTRAIACTQVGFDARTRAVAVGTVAKLAHHDPDAAFAALVPLLKDKSLRTVRAAGDALVQMKHPKAAEAITAMLTQEKAEEIAWMAGQWLRALRR